MSWERAVNTTPAPEPDEPYPSPEVIARERLLDAWRAGDTRRLGVMARQGYYAGWQAAMRYVEDEKKAEG